MTTYIWLVVFLVPPWVASEIDAPKWVLVLSILPFFIRAATLNDEAPDEYLLGEGFAQNRVPVLVVLVVSAVILGFGLLMVVKALL